MWCKIRWKSDMSRSISISKPRIRTSDTTRASVSFPSDVYCEMERIAASKKVSVAWVVREAAERYVAEEHSPQTDRSKASP